MGEMYRFSEIRNLQSKDKKDHQKNTFSWKSLKKLEIFSQTLKNSEQVVKSENVECIIGFGDIRLCEEALYKFVINGHDYESCLHY